MYRPFAFWPFGLVGGKSTVPAFKSATPERSSCGSVDCDVLDDWPKSSSGQSSGTFTTHLKTSLDSGFPLKAYKGNALDGVLLKKSTNSEELVSP